MSANEITGVKKQPTDADKKGNRGKASAKRGRREQKRNEWTRNDGGQR
jgi:hypothetical protein